MREEATMSKITLDLPEDSVAALQMTPEQIGVELRLAAAVKLFELGRLSSGAAAGLAGIPKPVFLQKLGDYGVNAFDLTAEELAQETRLGGAVRVTLDPLEGEPSHAQDVWTGPHLCRKFDDQKGRSLRRP
jgi:predicted HTH domain antitoxin